MRLDPGATISTVAHVAILVWLTVALPSPDALPSAPVDALPVDLVPISDVTNIHKGSKSAPKTDAAQASPVETAHKDRPGEDVGDATKTLDAPPTPKPAERAVTPATEAPPPPPSPDPAPVTDPTPPPPPPAEQQAAAKPAAEPPPPPAETPDPAPPEPTPDPAPQEAPQDAQQQANATPAPPKPVVPQAKPTPPKPTPKSDAKKTDTAQKPDKAETKNFSDNIAALLNKAAPSGGGTASAKDPVALGAPKGKGSGKLSQTELDALRGQIAQCWRFEGGVMDANDLVVRLEIHLNPDGTLLGTPKVVNSSGNPAFQSAVLSARVAVLKCQPYKLPLEKYDTWKDVIVNFDPREMIGG